MIIYLLVFAIAISLTYWAQRYFENSQKAKGIVLSVLVILIISLLSGFRSSEVGTDVEYYALPAFNDALKSNYTDFIRNTSSYLEIGYSTLVFVIAKLTDSFQMLLFVTHFIIMTFIYKFIYYNRKEISMHLSLMVFLFVFYNMTLNLMRQSISIAIILYSIVLFENRKYLKSILLFAVSMLFHKSAIFALPIFILNIIFKKIKNYKGITFLLNILLIILASSSGLIIFWLASKNMIPSRYYYYFTSYKRATNYKIYETSFKLIWIIMYMVYINLKKENKNYKKFNFYFELLMIDFLLFPISFTVSNAYRLPLVYWMTGMLTIVPNLVNLFKKNRSGIILGNLFIISILAFYWSWMYIYHGYEETYPYKLFI